MRGTLEERFWSKVNRVDSDCWDWLGARGPNGYGHFSPRNQKIEYAHRVAYREVYGLPLAPEQEIDHLCRNRGCVRKDHLRAVPPGFNRMQGATGQTAIKRLRLFCEKCGESLRQTISGRLSCAACRRQPYREHINAYRRARRALKWKGDA